MTLGGSGTGSVASSPGGITCGGDCTEDYTEGTVVTLISTANLGSTFVGWSGAADCSDGSVTMNGNRRCTATFDLSPIVTFVLTVSKTGSGSGTVTTSPAGINCGADCTESYGEGTIVTLIPNPAGGSTFAGWSGGADCVDGSVTMNGTRSCIATFDVIPPNTLAVTLTGTGSGTVTSDVPGIMGGINCPGTCSAVYPPVPPVTVMLTATPDMNSTFGGWGGACAGAGTNLQAMVTMNSAKGCTATFTQIEHTLTVSRIGSGSGSVFSTPPRISCGPTCMATFDQGSVVMLTAAPSTGSVFSGWSGVDCSGMANPTNVTMDAPKSCTATFIPQHQLDVTVTLNPGATGSVMSNPGTINCTTGTCGELFDEPTPVTLTAATAGIFLGWGGDCAAAGTNLQAMVTMTAARACTATFDP